MSSTYTWNPEPHWPSDLEMLERAVRYGHIDEKRGPRWLHVMNTLQCGSTVAIAMCRRYDLNPDEVLPARKRRA